VTRIESRKSQSLFAVSNGDDNVVKQLRGWKGWPFTKKGTKRMIGQSYKARQGIQNKNNPSWCEVLQELSLAPSAHL